MKYIFLMNLIVSLGIFLLISFNFFKYHGHKRIRKVFNYLFVIGLLYFIISIFSFLWFFKILNYADRDFLFIFSIVIVIQNLFLFRITYFFSENKKFLYFLIFYLITLFSLFSDLIDFFHLFLITSFLLSLLIFIGFSLRSDVYRKVGYLGILYCCISLIFQLFLLFGIGKIYFFSLFSNLIFFILILNFIKDLKKFPPPHRHYIYKKRSYFFNILRYFVFVITLTNFVFIGTVGIHEFGHFTISRFYDCEYARLIYGEEVTYTETLCGHSPNKTVLLLGGVLLPFILSLFLFIIGGKFIRDIALLVVGFNLIFSHHDFLQLGISENLVTASVLFGILFLVAGVMLLARSITEDPIHSIFEI